MKNQNNLSDKSKLSATQILKLLGETNASLTSKELQILLEDSKVDRVLGSLFGAFIGDALGSYCQFTSKKYATSIINKTMSMPGGGPFKLEPGQITDDSQMAIHLLTALLSYVPGESLEEQLPQLLLQIADQYVAWKNSIPFDIGRTCQNGLVIIESETQNKSANVEENFQKLKNAFKEVSKVNGQSLSNGFLMRITPLACLHSLLSQKNNKESLNLFHDLIQGDNKMTHAKIECFQASIDYVELISSLILRQSHEQISQITKKFQDNAHLTSQKSTCQKFLQQAIQDYKRGGDYMMCATQNEGFFKIAYVYCFQFLKYISENCKSPSDLSSDLFKDVLSKVVSQGGDTDTNACIVGGVIGSIVGFRGLPVQYLQKLLGLRLGKNNTLRQQNELFYEPRKAFEKIILLIKKFR